MGKKEFPVWRQQYWVAGTRSCSWALPGKGSYLLLISGGFTAHEWTWTWPKACVATGAPWPSRGFPAAAVLRLFWHLRRAPISCHGLVPSHQGSRRWLSFILDFRRSWGHSTRCRLRHLISFPHDIEEKMFINTWHLTSLPRTHSRMRLCKSSSVARQAPAEIVLTTQLSVMIPPNGNISQQSCSPSGWDFWAQPMRPMDATWTTK